MKPTLEDILLATLDWHYTDLRFWDNYQRSRSSTIVAIKGDFCVLASYFGFSNSDIGEFLHMRETTVINLMKDIKEEYADFLRTEVASKIG